METQLKLKVDLTERGTYENLADLKEQITLFAKQLFNNDELEEDELKDDDDEFAEETDDSFGMDEEEEIEDTNDEDDFDPTR